MSRALVTAPVLGLMLLLTLSGCSSPKQEEPAQSSSLQQSQPAEQPQGTAASPENATTPPPAGPGANVPERTAKAPASTPPASRAAAPTTPAAGARAAAPAAVSPAEPPAPPKPVYANVPEGTTIPVRLNDGLSSEKSTAGDKFAGMLDADLEVDGRVLFKRGTPVAGEVTRAERSGRVQGRAELEVTLTGIERNGELVSIRTVPLSFQAESTVKKDAAKIGIAAGIGTAIGAIAGGGKGAAIGAAVGGGAGTATVVATRGNAVELATETKLTFKLSRELQVRVQ